MPGTPYDLPLLDHDEAFTLGHVLLVCCEAIKRTDGGTIKASSDGLSVSASLELASDIPPELPNAE